MIINTSIIEVVPLRTRNATSKSSEPKEPKVKVPSNLISAKVIEYKHLKFKVEIDNKLLDVVVINYNPKIIFSAKINDYWEYPKPATVPHKDNIYDLDIYWDYLYDDLEVKGIVKDNTFILDNNSLYKQLDLIYKEYLKQQLKELRLNKKK